MLKQKEPVPPGLSLPGLTAKAADTSSSYKRNCRRRRALSRFRRGSLNITQFFLYRITEETENVKMKFYLRS